MNEPLTVEDERGVDITQIRAQLALSVPERVRVMVEAANRLIDLQEMAMRDGEASA